MIYISPFIIEEQRNEMIFKWFYVLKGFCKKLITSSDKFWHTQVPPGQEEEIFLDLYAFISSEIPN